MIKKIKTLLKLRNVVLIIGGILLLIGGINIVKSVTAPVTVEIGSVKRGRVNEVISVSGYLKPERKADLGFGATTSKVIWLNAKVGDNVATGSALLSLDQTLLINDVTAAKAALAQANAAYNSAKAGEVIAHETYNNIRYEGSGRIAALKDQAFEAARSADDGVTAATAALNSAKNNLARSVLTTPISGTVTIQKGVVGEIPTTNPLVQVIDLNSLYFEVLVNELDLGKLKIGQKVLTKLNTAKDLEIEGQVSFVSPTTIKDSNNNIMMETKIKITNSNGVTLRPGLEGDAQIVVEERENTLLIPFESIVEESNQKFVWVVTNNTIAKKSITTGLEGELDTEVTSGLIDGEKVVLNPTKTLKNGQQVTVK